MTGNDGVQTWKPEPLPTGENQSPLGEQQALFEGHAYYVAGTDWPFLSPEMLGDDDAYELLASLDDHRSAPKPPEAIS